MGTFDSIRELAAQRLRPFRNLFKIPPVSESMAGVIILFTFLNSIATWIWMFNAWTPYIYKLSDGSNMQVGIMAGINGICELCAAMVSGHIADKVWGPSRTLRYAVMFGVVNLAVVLIAVWSEKLLLLMIGQAFEGCYMGFSFTCVESVFAQCMRRGERDRLYSIKYCFESLGPIVGLLLSVLLFYTFGDEWQLPVLRVVMTLGLSIHLVSMLIFLYLFKPMPSPIELRRKQRGGQMATDVTVEGAADGKTPSPFEVEDARIDLDSESEDLSVQYTVVDTTAESLNCARTSLLMAGGGKPHITSRYEPSVCTARDDDAGSLRNCDGAAGGTGRGTGPDERTCEGSTHGEEEDREEPTDVDASAPAEIDPDNIPVGARLAYDDPEYDEAACCRRTVMDMIPLSAYPYILASCDIILVAGSGITTQYFPLFMMNLYGVSPATLALLNLANSLIISFMAMLNGSLGRRYGRVRALLPPKLLGCCILLYMTFAQRTVYGTKALMCVAYVLRNALMNCSAGLSRALIMDLVPEKRHGRWNAIESVQSAGWSGTAYIGGMVADKWGYGASFIVTFSVHLTSCVCLIPLTVRNDSRLPRMKLIWDVPTSPGFDDGSSASGKGPVVVAALTAHNVRKIPSCISFSREVDVAADHTSSNGSSEDKKKPA